MKSLLSRQPAARKTSQKEAPPKEVPLSKYRTWKVTINPGSIEQQLKDAGLDPHLRELKDILQRCPVGRRFDVTAYEVTQDVGLQEAKMLLETKGVVLCCSCEFGSWAAQHGNDVDQEATWLSETLRNGTSGQPAAIVLSLKAVHTIKAPQTLKKGMMLLAISKKMAETHRDK